MHTKENVELVLEALELGFSRSEVAELTGLNRGTISNWVRGLLPHSYTGKPARMKPPENQRGRWVDMLDENGEEMTPAEIENILLRAVLADLKAEGSSLQSISKKNLCALGERLRAATGLPLKDITAFLKISKSTYEYHRARRGYDKYKELRVRIKELFDEGNATWGYRSIWARLRREGTRVSEKVVRRLMCEEGLEVIYTRRRRRPYSSYKGEISPAPNNIAARDFHANGPDELWVTDISEFKVGDKGKVYLSAILDCFDGKPVFWVSSTKPSGRLATSTLRGALSKRDPDAITVIHSDRGFHYRTKQWKDICKKSKLIRSMSRKSATQDNSAMEGFFGRVKNEFYYWRDWSETSVEEFMARLNAYLEYYCERRIKKSLGWLSPNEYRRSLGYAV